MAEDSLGRYLVLPELRLLKAQPHGPGGCVGPNSSQKEVSEMEVCPRCATPSTSVWWSTTRTSVRWELVEGKSGGSCVLCSSTFPSVRGTCRGKRGRYAASCARTRSN